MAATKKQTEAAEGKPARKPSKNKGVLHNKNAVKKKGEEGYHERNTAAAHEASSIFPDAEELRTLLDEYFDGCDAAGKLYSPAGWCLYLSAHNEKGRMVSVRIFDTWHDGEYCKHLQETAEYAYARYREQIETDPRYQEKGMVTRSIFLQKQIRMGGYQDKVESKNDQTFRFVFGNSMDESDFK